jgi:hypothetical protein
MRPFAKVCLALLAASAGSAAHAYVFSSPSPVGWKAGTPASPTPVTFQLELQSGGPSDRALIDGATSWNQVAAAALGEWNLHLVTMQYKWVMDSTAAAPFPTTGTDTHNGINTVTWEPSIYGEDWGSAVGLTSFFYPVSVGPTGFETLNESDVIFNSNTNWDSYRGPVRLSGPTDLRRVAIHEFGHALGLDHPDDTGQKVSAIMNALVSNVDDVTADDIAGAGFLYNLVPAITNQPQSNAVTPGSTATFAVATSNDSAAGFQWKFNGVPIAGATSALLNIFNASAGNQGNYSVVVGDRAGTITSALASLTVADGATITGQPASQSLAAGKPIVLSVAASGTNLTYQWTFNGVAIPGATGPTYTVVNAGAADSGVYAVALFNGTTTTTSVPATVAVNTDARLINLSTLAHVGPNPLTAGFVITGSGGMSVLLRGIGPALGNFGLSGVLSNPQLNLYNNGQRVLATNSGWSGSQLYQQAFLAVAAFPLPLGSPDAAILANLSGSSLTSSFSTAITGLNGSQGLALIEVYDNDLNTAPSRFTNLSVLAFSDLAPGNLTAGFVVKGNSSLTVLIRAAGPAMSDFGVAGLLAQPVLTVYSQGTPIASNAGWGGSPKLAAAFVQTGAFAFSNSSADSALLLVLPPGVYSAAVSGGNNTTGTALIEIYEMR